jgi:excisionase family DNA binding protein
LEFGFSKCLAIKARQLFKKPIKDQRTTKLTSQACHCTFSLKRVIAMKTLLNTTQTAELLGIKAWTLRSWVSHCKIPYVKLGRLVRFDEEAIRAFIQDNSVDRRDEL